LNYSFHNWLLAARPKTLVATVAPVLIGAAYVSDAALLHPWLVACALLSALCIQIGTNFVNDYADFKKGADNAKRLGPTRVTQAGLITPAKVKRGAAIVFGLAVAFGIPLILRGGPPILIIGLLSILFGWAYTAGPYPLGYNGLGELFVFLFFGCAAVIGTSYALTLQWLPLSGLIACAPGLHASALLAVNNVRDVDTDRIAGKRTLAARFGRTFGRIEYAALMLLPYMIPVLLFTAFHFRSFVLLPLFSLPLTVAPIRKALTRTDGPSLIQALVGTTRVQLAFGLLFAAGLAL
jgi:1,4-dihydroxy-2-naphthoate octaprenyltransferase